MQPTTPHKVFSIFLKEDFSNELKLDGIIWHHMTSKLTKKWYHLVEQAKGYLIKVN